MPASTRLLEKLKETWGEEVTQDLVTWVNEASTVNRAELRELAELYFARFGDRLEARLALSEAQFEARLDSRIAASETRLEQRIAAWESKFQERMTTSEAKFEERMTASEAKFEERMTASEAKFEERMTTSEAKLEGRMAASEAGAGQRMATFDGRLTGLDERLTLVRLDIGHVDGRLDAGLSGLRAEVATLMRDQMKWMFVFWAGTIVPLAGLMVGLAKGWL